MKMLEMLVGRGGNSIFYEAEVTLIYVKRKFLTFTEHKPRKHMHWQMRINNAYTCKKLGLNSRAVFLDAVINQSSALFLRRAERGL